MAVGMIDKFLVDQQTMKEKSFKEIFEETKSKQQQYKQKNQKKIKELKTKLMDILRSLFDWRSK